MTSRKAIALILIASVLWGTTGTAQTFAPDTAHPVALGAIRLAIGGIVLLIIMLIQGKIHFNNWIRISTFIAIISMAAYHPLFFSAVSLTGVAIGTVVAIGSAPILAGLLEWIVNRSFPHKTWWIATILAIIGCLLLTLNSQEVIISPKGIFMALGAGLAFAMFTISNKYILKHHSPEEAVAVVFTLAALLLSPLYFVYDFTWFLQVDGLVVSLHLGLIATALAYIFYSNGLIGTSAATAVTLSLAEPLTASVLGVLVVRETLTWQSSIGVVCIFLGLVLLSFRKKRGAHNGKT
ncbi:EamA family transporter [Gracilibacillus sp. YIM 98692]|uniref:DMT family transporter n=1 Tax=Gracilibacillus sp. YIM 98692 TaxID=2663532 RepID=UPI0013D607C1|nr:EamA family transporter [Gracilibacillus sp. YIM 98692]